MSITAELEDGTTLEFPDGTDTAVIQRTVKKMIGQQQPPSTARVALQSAAKGAASIPDMFLGIPANLANLGMAGVGYVAGELGRPDIAAAMPIIESPAATRPVRSGLEAMGAIRPEFEPVTAGQRILGRALETAPFFALSPASGVKQLAGNLATGAVSGLASGVTKEATGSDLAAGAVGMLTPFAVSAVKSIGTGKMTNTIKQETLKEASEVGYVVPPSSAKPTFATNRLESIAGKAAVNQEAALRNQQVTNKLAAKSVGLPENTPLTESALAGVREKAGEVYAKVQSLSPSGQLTGMKVSTIADRPMLPGPATGLSVKKVSGPAVTTGLRVNEIRDASGKLVGMKTGTTSRGQVPGSLEGMNVRTTTRGQDVEGPMERLRVSINETRSENPLEKLKQLRADAKVYYRHHDISGDPKSLKRANAFSKQAESIENDLEKLAEAKGVPELINELRAARILIAKTYDVERALNIGDGNISARMIGRMLDKGAPLTGELRLIGRFSQAFPSVTREAASVPAAGVSGTDAAASALLGTMGYGAAGVPGIMAAGLPLLRGPARAAVLSRPMQNRLVAPPAPLGDTVLQSLLAGRMAVNQ